MSRPFPGPSPCERARRSAGISAPAIYRMVERALEGQGIEGGTLLDVGCGTGSLKRYIGHRFERYVGADILRYDELPKGVELVEVDLDSGAVDLPDASADVVAAVETIEHLENPRAFLRELGRLARPGGWVIVTTPNQESLLSLATLVLKRRFAAFQDVHYPAHISALLEIDLRRMAAEAGLTEVAIQFSLEGRIVLTPRHFPRRLSQLFPRALSDNVVMMGRKEP